MSVNATSIRVKWGNVPSVDQNGVIVGFKVFWKAVSGGFLDKTTKKQVIRDPPLRELYLFGLEEHVVYSISVLAFTNVGDGPNGTVFEKTHEAGKFPVK